MDNLWIRQSWTKWKKKNCRHLKNHTAARKDGLPIEFSRVESEGQYNTIHQFILRVWSEKKLPTDRLEWLICPIFIKKLRYRCSNYQGVTLLNFPYKSLFRILFHRLGPLRLHHIVPDVHLETDPR